MAGPFQYREYWPDIAYPPRGSRWCCDRAELISQSPIHKVSMGSGRSGDKGMQKERAQSWCEGGYRSGTYLA